MLQAHQIKKEPTDSSGSKKSPSCTCKKKCLENSTSMRQVLVNFGLSRKKVFTLNGKANLHELFTSYVLNEPAFSSLLKDSYVVFQEFNEKFGSWVDVDQREDFFKDGDVVNAVFFPQSIERDDNNPGSIRKSGKDMDHIDSKRVLSVDLSIDDCEENFSVDCSSSVDENNPNAGQKKLRTEEEESEEASEHQTKNGYYKSKRKRNSLGVSHLRSNWKSAKKVKLSKFLGTSKVKYPKIPPLLPTLNNTENYDAAYNSPQSSFLEEMSGQNDSAVTHSQNSFQRTQKYVNDLQNLCSDMMWPDPVYDIKENMFGSVCKVEVNGNLYYAQHVNREIVAEVAAKKILNVLKSDNRPQQRPYNRYNYRSRW